MAIANAPCHASSNIDSQANQTKIKGERLISCGNHLLNRSQVFRASINDQNHLNMHPIWETLLGRN
jgi:hypothetical protein